MVNDYGAYATYGSHLLIIDDDLSSNESSKMSNG